MSVKKPADLIPLTMARKVLGVSQAKIAQLVKNGTLTHYSTPLDARVKLVSRKQVESLRFREAA